MTKRLLTLGVATESEEDYFATFQDISELGRNLAVGHDYVNVTARILQPGPNDPPNAESVSIDPPAGLYHDEQTMITVRRRIGLGIRMTPNMDDTDAVVKNVIRELSNAGILFRERPNSRG